MQEETEIPDSWSDHDTGVHRPLLPSSDPNYSPTQMPIPIQPGSDSEISVQSVNGMDVDDGFQPIPLGMLGISPDLITRQDDLSPVSGPRALMVVVVSDSGDEADFYSDDSEGHQSDGKLARHIPMTVVVSDSDSGEEQSPNPESSVVPSGFGYAPDPTTGRYTADSFLNVPDEWL